MTWDTVILIFLFSPSFLRKRESFGGISLFCHSERGLSPEESIIHGHPTMDSSVMVLPQNDTALPTQGVDGANTPPVEHTTIVDMDSKRKARIPTIICPIPTISECLS